MQDLTLQQKNRLLAAAEIVEKGDMAVLEKILDFQDFLDENKLQVADFISIIEGVNETFQGNINDTLSSFKEEIGAINAQVGEQGEKGEKGDKGKDGKEGRDGRDGRDGVDGVDGKDGIDGKDAPALELDPLKKEIKEIRDKLPSLERMDYIERVARENAMPVTTAFYNGLRAKNLTIVGATAVQRGDTVFVTTTGGGGHTIQDEGVALPQRTNLNFKGAGVTATDDVANDATIVTISTSAGAGYQQPALGTVNGTNKAFTFAVAPNALVVDGVSFQKVSVDTSVNWTGTTSITLTVAPNFDLYGIA